MNQRFADRFLARENPLGQWLRIESPFAREPLRLEVVGVIESERQIALNEDPVPGIYLPHSFELMPFATFFVRIAGGAAVSPSSVQKTLQDIDREVAVDEAKAMENILADSIAEERTLARLLGVCALLALLLATGGLYGIMSLAVGQRIREFGIRLSLGATPRQIIRSVLGSGFGITLGPATKQPLHARTRRGGPTDLHGEDGGLIS